MGEAVHRAGARACRKRRRARFVAAAALTLAVTTPIFPIAFAETPSSAEDAAKRLESQQGKLAAKQARDAEIQKDLTSLADERREINARLVETAALVQKSEAAMTAIEQRLAGFERQEKDIRVSLAREHAKIAGLLAALQRMGRNPPPVIITQREDALEMVRSAMLIARAFPEMRGEAMALTGRLNELMEIMASIRREGDALRAETERLNSTQILLASLLETKKQSLADRQTELSQVREATAEISQNVADLSELIEKLSQQVSQTPMAAAEEAPADAVVAVLPPPATPETPPVELIPEAEPARGEEVALLSPEPGVGTPPSSIVELAPENTSLVPGKPDRIKPSIAFHQAKGKLPLPAQGRRVLGFNDKTQYGGTSQGLVIETRFGARVTSPCDGWVVYAGEFRSYGQLLIINAGGGYHVLVAGLSHMDVGPGQFVLAAEPIGTMSGAPRTAQLAAGSTDMDQSAPQASAPVLYIEFRKDGRPVDSGPWWVASHQKVQE
ncbi:peptidase M23 [Hyphomicrobium nitrativorans NL23]|uniref:Peptidase M23 n=1 Tax=Hyphomicrobium nitrativorans NL23 TaxID=1029756 RepID=V5SBW0_9HYPH|nr:peptidase M23 [Hyphomicrobium nitrativorans NL23]